MMLHISFGMHIGHRRMPKKNKKNIQKFNVEEIYQNIYVQPKIQCLETIFEEPKIDKNGTQILTSSRKYKRFLHFDETSIKIQKRRIKAKDLRIKKQDFTNLVKPRTLKKNKVQQNIKLLDHIINENCDQSQILFKDPELEADKIIKMSKFNVCESKMSQKRELESSEKSEQEIKNRKHEIPDFCDGMTFSENELLDFQSAFLDTDILADKNETEIYSKKSSSDGNSFCKPSLIKFKEFKKKQNKKQKINDSKIINELNANFPMHSVSQEHKPMENVEDLEHLDDKSNNLASNKEIKCLSLVNTSNNFKSDEDGKDLSFDDKKQHIDK